MKQKDYGIFLYCLLLFISLVFAGDGKGYAKFRSDWRNVEVDYATNAIVCNYYNPNHKAGWLRSQNQTEIIEKLNAGETLKIGVDYYWMYGVTLRFEGIPISINELMNGKVFIVEINRTQARIVR